MRLGAVEWVFPEEPAEPPMEGATYGAFPAACHYDDGLFVAAASEDDCAATYSGTGSGFTFWHPDLVTFHVWAWMHNPDGHQPPDGRPQRRLTTLLWTEGARAALGPRDSAWAPV